MSESHFDTFVRAVGACQNRGGILGDEGVVYPPRKDYGYEATPRNAMVFGAMGVDGVHYAVLEVDGRIDNDAPVIQIAPMDFSDPYSVLADSFIEYCSHGCGVSRQEMKVVFERERAGESGLVEFLKLKFDQSRLWKSGRNRSIQPIRHLLEVVDW
jgi:hypothetical protein